MKSLKFLKPDIEECEKESFRQNLLHENLQRSKIMAFALIGFELILSAADICSSLLKVDDRFHFSQYLVMYLLMIVINVSYLVTISRFRKMRNTSPDLYGKMEPAFVPYVTLIMTWGSVVSLMDQELYGNLSVFMINMIICSVVYLMDIKTVLIPYFVSVAVLTAGLPFFQKSTDILIGHYVNVAVFILVSWLASRLIYLSYCNDFNSKVLLKKSNELLEKEIEENRRINNQLTMANLQLKEAVLIDDLTGIPNRRSFRNYVDTALENCVKHDTTMSFLMIDIDFFKEYNDHFGHKEGDQVLIVVANQINPMIRNHTEFFARWGGEEFIYTVLNITEEDLAELADFIRQNVYQLEIPHEFSRHRYLSVSIGTCTVKIIGQEDISKGIELADKALYFAKNSGRNCVKNISDMADICPKVRSV